jgi:ElaB/YqjD/DUF883 family membrane-anchored ribosome-binding protein
MGKQSHDRNRLLVLYECGIKWAKKLDQLTDTLEHNLWSSEAVSDRKRKNAQSWVRATTKTQREWSTTRRAISKFSRKMVRHKNRSVTGTKKFGGVEEKNSRDIGWAFTRLYGDINRVYAAPTSTLYWSGRKAH